MYRCISLWLIVIAIIMTFCVRSHQKQLENDSTKSDANGALTAITSNGLRDDDTRNYGNSSVVKRTEPIKLDTDSINLLASNSSIINKIMTNNVANYSSQTAANENTTLVPMLNERHQNQQQQNTADLAQSNFPELTTEKLSLTNKTDELVSESLLDGSHLTFHKNNNNLNHSLTNSSNSNTTHQIIKSARQHVNSNSLGKSTNDGGIRISGQKIEMPVLNDFFDHSAYLKKHEHGFRKGPHFETGNVTNITVQVGNTFYLHCRISLLQDKTVSWVRRKSGENGLELLTVGKQTYSGDPRYSVDFQYPNNWRLKIVQAEKIDEATYECQISTSPPRFIHYNVRVNAPTIFIVDEQGIPLLDKYYEVDSTIQLTCIVRHISMMSSVVFWKHNNNTILNYDVTRGGISVKTDLMEIGANSTILVAKVNKTDSGNYSCSIGESQQYTILVHVLNESLAELHHSGCSQHFNFGTWRKNTDMNLLMIALLFSMFHQFIVRTFR